MHTKSRCRFAEVFNFQQRACTSTKLTFCSDIDECSVVNVLLRIQELILRLIYIEL